MTTAFPHIFLCCHFWKLFKFNFLLSTTVEQLASHMDSAALENMKCNLINSKEFTHGNCAVLRRDLLCESIIQFIN
jgi:hypothetical protein